MKKLILQLSGGIGNQLFQYHAGYAVAEDYGAVMFIDDSRVSKGRYVRSNRDSGLSSSNLRGILGVNEIFLRNGFIHDFLRMNKWKLFVPFLKSTLVDTSPNAEIGVNLSIGDIRRVIPDLKTIRLRGNLQSLQIIEYARDKGCLPVFRPKDVNPSFFHTVDQMTSQSILGIHLRAKDYGMESNMTKLSDRYYRKAIEMAFENKMDATVWIFTDSEVDARRKYGWIFDLPNLKVVKAQEFNDLETLYVMSKIDQLIISNSTFSFWGGIFNSAGKIYAPEPWFHSPGKIIGDSLSSEVNLVHFQFPKNWTIIKWI